jgi:carbamoyltransferase
VLEDWHRDLAWSLQARLEDIYLGVLKKLAERTGLKCRMPGRPRGFQLRRKRENFRPHWVRTSLRAARRWRRGPRRRSRVLRVASETWQTALLCYGPRLLGPSYSREEVRRAVDSNGLAQGGYSISELNEEELVRRAAAILADGKILGWFQGRAEWGPRAFANRSIVADPRRPEMKEILNRRIKHREIFRPFAPSILAETTAEYFEKSHPSPFMTLAYSVRPEKRNKIPAPTHVDGTGGLQTVTREANPRYQARISVFRDLSGVPVVLNTSFNDNEPIVCRPEEAVDCFVRTQMDALVLGDFLISRA